ncbi:unnamed protein product, partial [Microthlaspi erraticum]
EQVPCALKEEGLYSFLMSNFLASQEDVHSMSSDAAEVLIAIFESWHCWKNSEGESLVTSLFTLEVYETMTCGRCRRKPNYPEQSSYGLVMEADAIRDVKCAFRDRKFEDILKVILMDDKMVCDIGTGGCGKENFVHRIVSKCPPIFTIVLEWETDETEEDIAKTTKALEREIDLSSLYEGLEPNKNYQLVSMVCCGEEEEEEDHICLAYEKDRWVSLRHDDALAEEDVGDWNSVVNFCGERKVRPEILFYEASPIEE